MSKQGRIWSCLDTQLDINATEKILATKSIKLIQTMLKYKTTKIRNQRTF